MCTRRGFTLRDLIVTLVVLLLLAFVYTLFMPYLGNARELAKRAACAMNLSNLGKAIALYKNNNSDRFPFMDGPAAWDSTPTGTNRATEPKADTPHAVTAMMFLLIRDGQSAKFFCCPCDADVTEDTNLKDSAGVFYWDFSSAKNCSYGYQLPLANNSTGTFSIDPKLTGKAKDEAEAKDYLAGRVIIMADKAPAGDLGGYAAGGKANAYMSPNHKGQYINVLRQETDVINGRTPDCGTDKDYIYTASGKKDGGSQYGGSASQAKHLSELDSCIVGPK